MRDKVCINISHSYLRGIIWFMIVILSLSYYLIMLFLKKILTNLQPTSRCFCVPTHSRLQPLWETTPQWPPCNRYAGGRKMSQCSVCRDRIRQTAHTVCHIPRRSVYNPKNVIIVVKYFGRGRKKNLNTQISELYIYVTKIHPKATWLIYFFLPLWKRFNGL